MFCKLCSCLIKQVSTGYGPRYGSLLCWRMKTTSGSCLEVLWREVGQSDKWFVWLKCTGNWDCIVYCANPRSLVVRVHWTSDSSNLYCEMATMNNNSNIISLKGSNYATWKVQCQMALMKDNLWGIVDGSDVPPAQADAGQDNSKYEKYMIKRNRVLQICRYLRMCSLSAGLLSCWGVNWPQATTVDCAYGIGWWISWLVWSFVLTRAYGYIAFQASCSLRHLSAADKCTVMSNRIVFIVMS